jgi:hypothetical protein
VYEKGTVHSKTYTESTFKKDNKELDPNKAYMCLGIEERHDTKHRNEKEGILRETEISIRHRIKYTK